MNKLDKDYQALLEDIMENGVRKEKPILWQNSYARSQRYNK